MEQYTLICPICDDPNQHPVRVEVAPYNSNQRISISADQVAISAQDPAGTRGVGIYITFRGECGHTWRRAYTFHKGETELSTYETTGLDDEYVDTIWRDWEG